MCLNEMIYFLTLFLYIGFYISKIQQISKISSKDYIFFFIFIKTFKNFQENFVVQDILEIYRKDLIDS